MADKNFPGPNINRIIETDPQIVKIPLDDMGWGSRKSMFSELKGSPVTQDPAPPSAPEMTIKHSN